MLKKISILVVGTGSAQLVLLGAIPFLTREYGPEDFGALALVVAVATILSTISSGRYEAAIPIRTETDDSSSLLVISLGLLLVLTTVIAAPGLLQGQAGFQELLPQGSVNANHIPLFLLLLGIINVMTFWSIKQGRFKLISAARLTHALTTVAGQLALSGPLGSQGLIYGAIAGNAAYAGTLLIPALVLDRSVVFRARTFRRVVRVATLHKDFPLFASWSVLLNSLSNQLPNILFFRLASPSIAGFFVMANRAIKAPLAVIGQSIYQVIAQHVGDNVGDRSKVLRESSAVILKMADTAVAPFVLIALVVESAFEFVLGNGWGESGFFARLMLPWFFLLYLSWPLTAVYNTLAKQRQLLLFNGLFLFAAIAPFFLMLYGAREVSVVVVISLLSALFRLFYIFWILKPSHYNDGGSSLLRIVMYSLLIAVVAYLPLVSNG